MWGIHRWQTRSFDFFFDLRLKQQLSKLWRRRPSRVVQVTTHYSDVIMRAMASQITSVSTVWLPVCSGADQIKYQSSASLAFVRGIHRWPVDSPHKEPVTWKMFPFDDVIVMYWHRTGSLSCIYDSCRFFDAKPLNVTHRGRGSAHCIFNSISWIKVFEFQLKFGLNLFLEFQFSTGLSNGLVQATSHYLNQCWRNSKTPRGVILFKLPEILTQLDVLYLVMQSMPAISPK